MVIGEVFLHMRMLFEDTVSPIRKPNKYRRRTRVCEILMTRVDLYDIEAHERGDVAMLYRSRTVSTCPGRRLDKMSICQH